MVFTPNAAHSCASAWVVSAATGLEEIVPRSIVALSRPDCCTSCLASVGS